MEPFLVLKAFREGADRVFIGGCYLRGYYY
ncbi:hypothetical protein [Methanopyrus kandleri]